MKRVTPILLLLPLLWLAGPVYAQGVMTPSGQGAWGKQVFFSGMAMNKQPYSTEPLAVVTLGFGIGNPKKNLGVEIAGNMPYYDVVTLDVKLHKYLGLGTSLAIGSNNLFTTGLNFDYDNYYAVLSHDFRHNFHQRNPFSRLALSLGLGQGRTFSTKWPKDLVRDKPDGGTRIFGAAAIRLGEHIRLEGEWTGVNLNSFLTFHRQFGRLPLGLHFGFADLTSYSGDRILFVVGLGAGYRFR
ncbi:MAG: hypothetical protein KDC43_03980 [Saprospiraceae bacterium]|nr:hypothetical protein [Saprospiraceae bacterium]MCB0623084.1 hypothetical protein [Saprospiraceae bacterium]MCB0678442.1 hypothetical protein [Saprospiraceae bacterium]MCB0684311.1 hypothetical protein [Saprospiraceae bacterium]